MADALPRFLPPGPPKDSWPALEEILRFWRSKRILTSDQFEALSLAAKRQAGRLAGVWETKFVQAVYDSIGKSLAENLSSADWMTEAQKIVDAYGGGEKLGLYSGEEFTPWYACLLPGTVVEGAVVAASKARYHGPAIQIETDDGRRLRVTVNHPVLTPAGWESAGSIQQGDDLLCYGSRVEPLDDREANLTAAHLLSFPKGRAIDDQHVPARVEDIFEALLRERPAWLDVEGPVSPLDFYGDAAFFDGKVRVVRPDRMLPQATNTQAREMFGHRRLMHRFAGPESSLPGSGALALDLDGHDAATRCIAHRFKRPHSLPSFLGSQPIPRRSLRLGPASDLNPSRFQATEKRPGGDVHLARDLIATLPGQVTSHRVVQVQRIAWAGHIFDLQTRTGLIVAEGIITGNSTVFRTNVQSAFAAGRAADLFSPAGMQMAEYFMHDAVLDDRNDTEDKCPGTICRELNGKVFRKDDPGAGRLLAPLHYSCRCSEIELDAQDVEDGGYDIADASDFSDLLSQDGVWGDDKLTSLVHGPEAPMSGVNLTY